MHDKRLLTQTGSHIKESFPEGRATVYIPLYIYFKVIFYLNTKVMSFTDPLDLNLYVLFLSSTQNKGLGK